jgi:hypothetical protein
MTDHELEALILLWRRWCYWLEEPIGPETCGDRKC